MNTCFVLFFIAQISGNIIVIPDSGKKAISPYVFGSGDEMNASFSPLILTAPLIYETQPKLLRFGGIGAEYFDWMGDSLNGITYIDFVDTFTIPVPVNFGIDSMLRLCEYVGAEPILTVNMQTTDTSLARKMVEYVNGDTTTPMGNLRAQRGHPQPYNVKIWSLGNEPDIAGGIWPTPVGNWTFYRHFGIPFSNWSWRDSSFWTPQDFANLIPVYVQAMENASPIPLSFIYSIAGNPAWIRPVVEPNIDLIDYLDIHYYPSFFPFDSVPDTTDYIDWLSKTDTITPVEEYLQLFRDSLDAIGAYSIKIVVLEYNGGLIMAPDRLWWNYLDGLFIADCIGHLINKELELAGLYSIHEGNPQDSAFPYFGIIRGDTVSRRMASYVLELYSRYFGDTLIYSYSDHKNTGYGIECWASKRSSDGSYAFIIINKTLDTTYNMNIRIKDTIQQFHILSITNNAPLGAPYNGTTGIEDQGFVNPDSTSGGWSFLNYTFIPASIYLFEAYPYINVKEQASGDNHKLLLPNILKRFEDIKMFVPEENITIYSETGRKICELKKSVRLPSVSGGVYIIKIKNKSYKLIILKD